MIYLIDENFATPLPLKECARLSPCQERVNNIVIILFSEIKSAVLHNWCESIREQAKRIKDELVSTVYLNKMAYELTFTKKLHIIHLI